MWSLLIPMGGFELQSRAAAHKAAAIRMPVG
jgi:hypothetical protein